jgi:hypothetical protein
MGTGTSFADGKRRDLWSSRAVFVVGQRILILQNEG